METSEVLLAAVGTPESRYGRHEDEQKTNGLAGDIRENFILGWPNQVFLNS